MLVVATTGQLLSCVNSSRAEMVDLFSHFTIAQIANVNYFCPKSDNEKG